MPSRQPESAAKQRIKLAVAGLLAAVFAGVILFPSSPQGGENAAAHQTSAAPRSPATPDGPSTTSPSNPLELLPRVDLDSLIGSNPFSIASLAAAADPLRERAAKLAMFAPGADAGEPADESPDLQEVAVQAIVHHPAHPAVLIDGRVVGLNDTIMDGWRIVEVRPASVMVERVTD